MRSADDKRRVLAALRKSAAANGGMPRFYVVAREENVAAETCKRWWAIAERERLEAEQAAAASSTRRRDPRSMTALDFAVEEFIELDQAVAEAREGRSYTAIAPLVKQRREAFERVLTESAAVGGAKLTKEEVAGRLRAAANVIPADLAHEIIEVLRRRGIAA